MPPTLSRLDAAHLWRRAGFGATPAQLDAFTGLDRTTVVARMLDMSAAPAVSRPDIGDYSSQYGGYVRAYQWWIDRMRTTPAPLQEKLTLFWHGHFCSAQEKVYDIAAMWDQNNLFRTHGFGYFHELCQAVAIDPAMLVYLDNNTNRAGREQENFARELMELFTIGVGNFGESDVIAMAKAWTGYGTVGWNGTRSDNTFVYYPQYHDNSTKTLFGIARNWNGPDAISEIVNGSKRMDCARFIAAKMYRFFANANPTQTIIDELASTFATAGMHIGALVQAILLHDTFWDATSRYALVKTPTELVVDALRRTGLPAERAGLPWAVDSMGQILFNPPNVAGWPANVGWLSTSGMGGRGEWLMHLHYSMGQVPLWQSLSALSVPDAAQTIFNDLGILEPSTASRARVENWFTNAKATDPWSIQANALVVGAMTPEFHLA